MKQVFDYSEFKFECSLGYGQTGGTYQCEFHKQGFVTTKEHNARRLSPWIRQFVKQYALRILLGFRSI